MKTASDCKIFFAKIVLALEPGLGTGEPNPREKHASSTLYPVEQMDEVAEVSDWQLQADREGRIIPTEGFSFANFSTILQTFSAFNPSTPTRIPDSQRVKRPSRVYGAGRKGFISSIFKTKTATNTIKHLQTKYLDLIDAGYRKDMNRTSSNKENLVYFV